MLQVLHDFLVVDCGLLVDLIEVGSHCGAHFEELLVVAGGAHDVDIAGSESVDGLNSLIFEIELGLTHLGQGFEFRSLGLVSVHYNKIN